MGVIDAIEFSESDRIWQFIPGITVVSLYTYYYKVSVEGGDVFRAEKQLILVEKVNLENV